MFNFSATTFPICLPAEPCSLAMVMITPLWVGLIAEAAVSGTAADFRLRERMNCTVIAIITREAIRSAMGAAYRMPLIPKNRGRMITRGTKQMISRVREEITAWMGLPTAWKKIEVILMAQVRTTRARKIRKVISANSQ